MVRLLHGVEKKGKRQEKISQSLHLYTLKDAERSFFFLSLFLYMLFPYFLGSSVSFLQVSSCLIDYL